MQNTELTPQEQLSKQFLSPTYQNIQAGQSLNQYSNTPDGQALNLMPYYTNCPSLNPESNNFANVIVGQPLYNSKQLHINNQRFPTLEIKDIRSDLFEEQPFNKQKMELIKLLACLILGSGIEFFLPLYQYLYNEKELNKISPFIFPLCLVSIVILSIVAKLKLFQQLPLAILVFISYHLSFGFGLISFSRLFNMERPPGNDGLWITLSVIQNNILIKFSIILLIFSQFIYFCRQQQMQQFNLYFCVNQCLRGPEFIIFIASIIIIALGGIYLFFWSYLLLITGIIAFFYGISLPFLFYSLQKGAFSLRVNQVFVNINQIYSAGIIPCQK